MRLFRMIESFDLEHSPLQDELPEHAFSLRSLVLVSQQRRIDHGYAESILAEKARFSD